MSQKNNLVKNASFLMIAAMISKVIGLLYKSPLSSIVGNMGMGYIGPKRSSVSVQVRSFLPAWTVTGPKQDTILN